MRKCMSVTIDKRLIRELDEFLLKQDIFDSFSYIGNRRDFVEESIVKNLKNYGHKPTIKMEDK